MIVAGICLRKEKGTLEVLLIRSKKGLWQFPKGAVDPGEPPWYAAGRETWEEAGWYAAVEKEALGGFTTAKEEPVTAFLLTDPERAGNTPESGREPSWFSLPDAKTILIADHGVLVALEMTLLLDAAARRFREK